MSVEKKMYRTPAKLFFSERFTFLLVLMLFYMIVIPFFEGFFKIYNFIDISFTTVLLYAVYAVSHQKKQLIIASLLSLAVISMMQLADFAETTSTIAAFRIFAILFESYMVITILKFIFNTPVVISAKFQIWFPAMPTLHIRLPK